MDTQYEGINEAREEKALYRLQSSAMHTKAAGLRLLLPDDNDLPTCAESYYELYTYFCACIARRVQYECLKADEHCINFLALSQTEHCLLNIDNIELRLRYRTLLAPSDCTARLSYGSS